MRHVITLLFAVAALLVQGGLAQGHVHTAVLAAHQVPAATSTTAVDAGHVPAKPIVTANAACAFCHAAHAGVAPLAAAAAPLFAAVAARPALSVNDADPRRSAATPPRSRAPPASLPLRT